MDSHYSKGFLHALDLYLPAKSMFSVLKLQMVQWFCELKPWTIQFFWNEFGWSHEETQSKRVIAKKIHPIQWKKKTQIKTIS